MLHLEMQRRIVKPSLKMKVTEGEFVVNKFSYEEVLDACVNYFHGDELAATTWMNKYAIKTKDGFFVEKTPDDTQLRMAKEFARKEKE